MKTIVICLIFCGFSSAKYNFNGTHFHVYKDDGTTIDVSNPVHYSGIFSETSEIIIIIHGWTENSSRDWIKGLTKAYLGRKEKQYQVIVIDWGHIAKDWYIVISKFVQDIGNFVGAWMLNLSKVENISLHRFHIVAHSLGCQVASFAGKHIYNETGTRIYRITGLDAAGVLFKKEPEKRIVKGDAEIVVGIHTDDVLGYPFPYGDVDLFPNGGNRSQPGCEADLETLFGHCSHHRSHDFWTEAITRYTFYGTICQSWDSFRIQLCDHNKKLNFAGMITKADSGIYFTHTNDKKPFILDETLGPDHPTIKGTVVL